MKDCFCDGSSKGIFWETHAILQKNVGFIVPYENPDGSDASTNFIMRSIWQTFVWWGKQRGESRFDGAAGGDVFRCNWDCNKIKQQKKDSQWYPAKKHHKNRWSVPSF